MLLQSLLRPVLTPLMRGMFDAPIFSSAPWSPLALWPDGIATPGMWISPRDLTSQWADYTGTTPVATPGTVADTSNPVGLALDIRAGATVLTDPGNHMLQSTSTARPLLSAYDGQTLGPGNTYDSAGYPVFQKYDGVDDGMATAEFSAGTLTSSMDCLIAVRRDSAEAILISSRHGYIGNFADGGVASSCGGVFGSPSVYVNGVVVGSGVPTNGQLAAALTIGEFCIVEFRSIDLSTWTLFFAGGYWSYSALLNGALGDIMLYPSTASTTDKDAARQWLADYYGVTLP